MLSPKTQKELYDFYMDRIYPEVRSRILDELKDIVRVQTATTLFGCMNMPLTTFNVAHLLKMSVKAVQKMITRGKLKFHKSGKLNVITLQELIYQISTGQCRKKFVMLDNLKSSLDLLGNPSNEAIYDINLNNDNNEYEY